MIISSMIRSDRVIHIKECDMDFAAGAVFSVSWLRSWLCALELSEVVSLAALSEAASVWAFVVIVVWVTDFTSCGTDGRASRSI